MNKKSKIWNCSQESTTFRSAELQSAIQNVFGDYFFAEFQDVLSNSTRGKHPVSKVPVLETIQFLMRKVLDRFVINRSDEDLRTGRLGPPETKFDINTRVGHFIFCVDKLSINAQSNFSSILANTCVFQGKWQFEVQLGSKGIIQIGWALRNCKFSQEDGVGDISGSYAYDGNRKRKWNVSPEPYGEAWLSGDIISAALNLQMGSLEFYRNGVALGEAFSKIEVGPGKAYFPAVSLSFSENLVANFGGTPFKYPVAGYQPLQQAPYSKVAKADQILIWLNNFLYYHGTYTTAGYLSREAALMAIARVLFFELTPLLRNNYVIEACLLKFMKNILSNGKSLDKKKTVPTFNSPKIQRFLLFLDYFWVLTEESDVKYCLERIISSLLSNYRHVALVMDYPHQREALYILSAITMHEKTRRYLLSNILFDKIRFANFVHIKPLDDKGLKEVVPVVWWPKTSEDNINDITMCNPEKEQYLLSCQRINQAISGLEVMQVEFIKLLLINTDGSSTDPSTRAVFLRKFRIFIDENLHSWQSILMLQTPLPISLCCFHRIIVAVRDLWEKEIPNHPIIIPHRMFYDGSINFLNLDRLGGVLSYLLKNIKPEPVATDGTERPARCWQGSNSQGSDSNNVSEPESTLNGTLLGEDSSEEAAGLASLLPVLTRLLNSTQQAASSSNGGQGATHFDPIFFITAPITRPSTSLVDMKSIPPGCCDSLASLVELLDGLILLYHVAAHKQLLKVSSLRTSMEDYIKCLNSTQKSLQAASHSSQAAEEEFQQYIDILEKQISEQARHMAWVRAVLYSEVKQSHILWLLRILLNTVKAASATGPLYSFVPEYYIEAILQMMSILKNYIHPTVPLENTSGYEELFVIIEEFICNQFYDPRIVNANSKNTIVRAIAEFVSSEKSLRILENIDINIRDNLVRTLLKSYENRAWAPSNWILIRFWQGHGFAFRGKISPHLNLRLGPKFLSLEMSIIQTIEPCPSPIFQEHLKTIMLESPSIATTFVNSVLNQLNWAFSEFIDMLQEVHNLSSEPERVFIDSRQLRVCVTLFDLALALLRVLEMVAAKANFVFTDPHRDSSETLLERLCQLVCQILNRVSATTGSFHHVISLGIPDLELIDHCPLLTAVVGILLALFQDEMDSVSDLSFVQAVEKDQIPPAIKALLSEPSFQLSSLEFVLGGEDDDPCATTAKKRFSFLNYPNDISESEITRVRQMLQILSYYQQKISFSKDIDEDDMCTICYAYPISATFKPCDHQSCRSCIMHHLMNSKDCFFCKTVITFVYGLDDEILYSSNDD